MITEAGTELPSTLLEHGSALPLSAATVAVTVEAGHLWMFISIYYRRYVNCGAVSWGFFKS